jgi:hypothetical protein
VSHLPITIAARNVQQALPLAVQQLLISGRARKSRNGDVLVAEGVFVTQYAKPCERVLFYPQRDANPFFHLYEGLWMLAGRHDVDGPCKYVSSFSQFSDDGKTFHGAYGKRWRGHFVNPEDLASEAPYRDQLTVIVERLTADPNDRRCVLQMWDPETDLDHAGKDVPCNLTATLQRDGDGALDLVVYNRSNDLVLGAYGANAVHFSMMQEYVARKISCEVGTYTQVSSNMHVYLGTNGKFNGLTKVSNLSKSDPYANVEVIPCPMPGAFVDESIDGLLQMADGGWLDEAETDGDWEHMVWGVLRAHEIYRDGDKSLQAAQFAVSFLQDVFSTGPRWDWVVAAEEWLGRRVKERP